MNPRRRTRVNTRRLVPITSLIALLVLSLGATMVVGRGVSAAQTESGSHPAHIHSGSCATLGDVVYPLNDVGSEMSDAAGTPIAGMPMGPASAIPVEVSVTTVQTDLNTLVSGVYAINVHESMENIGNYIACGDIGGNVMGSDLAIGLGELNDSGDSGVAWLHDNGDGTTTVYIFLTEEYGDMGTPAAS
jgi:hypothetical protein